jgi:excisionase family DNA binding protein
MAAAIPDLITTREAAELLGVRPRMVRRLIEQGHLAPVPVGTWEHLYERAEVEALAAARRAHPPVRGQTWRRPEPEALAA